MLEILDRLNGQQLTGFLIVGSVMLTLAVVGLGAIFTGHLYRIRRIEIDAQLKQKMLEQGLSADDIVQVLQGSSERPTRQDTRACR